MAGIRFTGTTSVPSWKVSWMAGPSKSRASNLMFSLGEAEKSVTQENKKLFNAFFTVCVLGWEVLSMKVTCRTIVGLQPLMGWINPLKGLQLLNKSNDLYKSNDTWYITINYDL